MFHIIVNKHLIVFPLSLTQEQHSKCQISLASSYHFLMPCVFLQWHLLSLGHPPKPWPWTVFLFIASWSMFTVPGLTCSVLQGLVCWLLPLSPAPPIPAPFVALCSLSRTPSSVSTSPLGALAIYFCLGDLDSTGETHIVVGRMKTVIIIYLFHFWIVASSVTLCWALCG